MLVNPAKFPNVKAELGPGIHRLADLARRASSAIAGYKINGEQLFFPNAKPQAS